MYKLKKVDSMKFIKKLMAFVLVIMVIFGVVMGVYTLYPLKYTEYIRTVSEETGIDKYLIASIIRAESNYDEKALSNAGAKGLMQLTDETAAFCAEKMGIELNDGDVFNPEINIRLGVYYYKRVLELFDYDETLAIAAYNAGEGRVRAWLSNESYSSDGKTLDVIPSKETENHIKKIENYQKIYKFLYPNL